MVVAERLAAQLLSPPVARTPVEVVERLLAVQAQDARGARLAVRARSEGLTAADVDRALTVDRSLIVSWLNRGTLHLVRSADYWWLHALTTPQLLTGTMTRLGQEQVTPDAAERGVDVIAQALSDEGPLTRAQLRERVGAAGVRVEGQALVHQLVLATLRGLVVRGPVVGAEQAFVLVDDWLGLRPKPADREWALAELARRFLVGHAPASDRDLARWANVRLRDARTGLATCGAIRRPDGLFGLATPVAAPPLPAPLLLGAFDPLLHGWVSREPILGDAQGIVTTNGLFRPFALVRGKAAATWGLAGGRVTLSPFARLSRVDSAALEQEASDVLRFLAGP